MAFKFKDEVEIPHVTYGGCLYGSIVESVQTGIKFLVCEGGSWLQLETNRYGITSTVPVNSLPRGDIFKPYPKGTTFTFTSEV